MKISEGSTTTLGLIRGCLDMTGGTVAGSPAPSRGSLKLGHANWEFPPKYPILQILKGKDYEWKIGLRLDQVSAGKACS